MPTVFLYVVWKRVLALSKHILGDFEQIVLLAVHQQHGTGYSVSIADEVEKRAGWSISLGAVYATLDRLEKKGFVISRLGDPTPERGGRPKRFYEMKAPGILALSQAWEANRRRWANAEALLIGARA